MVDASGVLTAHGVSSGSFCFSLAQVPRLTDLQKEALRLYNALALSDRLRMDIMLAPGDIQLLSNHTQLHTRSAFTDHEVMRQGSLLPLCLD